MRLAGPLPGPISSVAELRGEIGATPAPLASTKIVHERRNWRTPGSPTKKQQIALNRTLNFIFFAEVFLNNFNKGLSFFCIVYIVHVWRHLAYRINE